MAKARSKMTKDVVPEGFTAGLALMDFLPCLFFALAALFLGLCLESPLCWVGAGVSFLSGLLKALWKLIVVKKKRNVWWMFLQMRIAMPVGLLLILAGFLISYFSQDVSWFWPALLSPAVMSLWIIGLLGMGAMFVFVFALDSTNPKANWVEQSCNFLSQLCFFLAFLLAYLAK